MPDIFISYAREDKNFAHKLYHDLRKNGVIPWLDSEDLLAGSNWKREISQAIRKSKYTLILLSAKSVSKRGYVQKEIKEALGILDEIPESEIFIVPARIEECEPLYGPLKDLNWVDLFPSYEEGFNKIVQTLRKNDEIGERIEAASQNRERAEVIPGLTREDTLVLQMACQYLQETEVDLIEPKEIEAQATAAGLEMDQVFDSIEVLSAAGILKSHGAMGGEIIGFHVTTHGFRAYAEHFVPQYGQLVAKIARIVVGNGYRSSLIASQLKCNHTVVKYILRELRDRDALSLSPTIGPEEKVTSFHAKLKRIAAEAEVADVAEVEIQDVALVWDPEILNPDDYAKLVTAIGDVARASGAAGVRRILTEYKGASVGTGVSA